MIEKKVRWRKRIKFSQSSSRSSSSSCESVNVTGVKIANTNSRPSESNSRDSSLDLIMNPRRKPKKVKIKVKKFKIKTRSIINVRRFSNHKRNNYLKSRVSSASSIKKSKDVDAGSSESSMDNYQTAGRFFRVSKINVPPLSHF